MLVIAEIGDVTLEKLRSAHVRKTLDALNATGLSQQSVKQAHALLHAALQDAYDDDLLTRNPAAGKKLKPKVERGKRRTYTREQCSRLFAAVDGTAGHALFVIMATTGLRIGETVALRWSDLDLDTSTLWIGGPDACPHGGSLQRQTGRGVVEVETKSKESRRAFLLSRFARRALDLHLERHGWCRRQFGESWNAADMIFPTTSGTLQDPREALRRFHGVTDALGLPQIRLQDLRHTTAILLSEEGAPAKQVQALLGHSSIGLTMDTYTHLDAQALQPIADAMDAIFEQVEVPIFHRS